MSSNPPTLRDLGACWTAHGGVNLGVVGNTAHTKGYHLGRDRIYDGAGPGIGDLDYSVQTARDKAGLTNAASAIDLGRLNGSLAELRAFSRWLVTRCTADPAIRRDIREIIYSPDGVNVQRYSGIDNKIHTGPGNGNSSHTGHSHISFFRDSEGRGKRPLVEPYFADPIDTSTEADMPALTSYIPGQVATVKKTANVRSAPLIAAGNVLRVVASAETWVVTGWVKGGVDPYGGSDQWVCRWNAGRWEYTAKSNVSSGPTAPVTDCTAAVKAATDPLKAQVVALETKVAADDARIAAAKTALG